MLLYSTLLCKKIARVLESHKKFMLTKLGGRNRVGSNHARIEQERLHLFLISVYQVIHLIVSPQILLKRVGILYVKCMTVYKAPCLAKGKNACLRGL